MFTEIDGPLLDSGSFAKLATLMPDGAPQNTVMWFRRAGNTLRMVAPAASRKALNLRRDPRVAVVIDDVENGYSYLELRGTAEVVNDDEAARRELRIIARKYIGDRADDYVASLSSDARVLIEISPSSVRRHLGQRPSAAHS